MKALEVGFSAVTARRTVGEGDVSLYAGLVGDFTPIHTDEVFARKTVHGTRIAHGPHIIGLAIGLATQQGIFGERVLGLVNINWDLSGSVKIGDTVHARVTVEALRPTSKLGRSLATYAIEVFNQDETIVQQGKIKVIVQD